MSEKSQRPFWLGEDKRTWDHVRVHLQVIKDARLGAIEMALYMSIAAHAELSTGHARPSKRTLAQYIGVSDERTVARSLKVLIDAGYITVSQRSGSSSVYTLLPPPVLPPTSDEGGHEMGGVHPMGGESLQKMGGDPPHEMYPEQEENQGTKDLPPNPPLFPVSPPLKSKPTPPSERVSKTTSLFTEVKELFCREWGTPTTRATHAAWATVIKDLTAIPNVTVAEIAAVITVAKREWSRPEMVTPHAIARNWDKLHAKVKLTPDGPKVERRLVGDHEKWMDLGAPLVLPPPDPVYGYRTDVPGTARYKPPKESAG